MTTIMANCVTTIEAALQQATTSVKQIAPAQWDFTMVNGVACKGAALMADGWLIMQTAADGPEPAPLDPADFWTRVRDSRDLIGGAKYVIVPGRTRLQVHAEVPMAGEPGALGARVDRACRGCKSALARLAGGDHDSPAAAEQAVDVDVAALCTESGWPAACRSSGEVYIALDAPGRSDQAVIERGDDRPTSLQVTVVACEELTDLTRRALGLLLLTAAAAIRWARPVAVESADGTAVGFAIDLDDAPDAAMAAEALAALSVACRICGNEIEAVAADEAVAQQYLSSRGWSSRAVTSRRRVKTGKKGPKTCKTPKAPLRYASRI